jgi:hypothetical protein
MDDRTTPPPASCALIRSCEPSRLQRQLLARAYQQLCPQVRRRLHDVHNPGQRIERSMGASPAARVAAGAESCCNAIQL